MLLSVGEDTEQLELQHSVGGNVSWYLQFRILFGSFLLKLYKCIAYDSAIPLLDIETTEIQTYVHKKTHTRIPTAALFIIAPDWKQYKYSLLVEWINSVVIIQ